MKKIIAVTALGMAALQSWQWWIDNGTYMLDKRAKQRLREQLNAAEKAKVHASSDESLVVSA